MKIIISPPLPSADDSSITDEEESQIIKDLIQAGVRRIHYRKELKVLTELGSVSP